MALGLASAAICAGMSNAQASPPHPQVYVAGMATFYLCPNIIRTGVAPPPSELEKADLTPISPLKPDTMWFQSRRNVGTLLFSYDPSEMRCTANYTGQGYEEIARALRGVAIRGGFARITGGDKGGAKADVFEGPIALDPSATARVIVIENYSDGSSAISYSERKK